MHSAQTPVQTDPKFYDVFVFNQGGSNRPYRAGVRFNGGPVLAHTNACNTQWNAQQAAERLVAKMVKQAKATQASA